jgi:hypothetical protein
MTKSELLLAPLIAALVATPATACTGHVTSRHLATARTSQVTSRVTSRHLADHANASVSHTAHDIRVPRVRTFAPAPPEGRDCDIGDREQIC